MLLLNITTFFIRGKIFVNLEAHKRQQNLFMKHISNEKQETSTWMQTPFYNLFLDLESSGTKGD